MINTTIEIHAPPSLVRAVLLEFPAIPKWCTNDLVQHISPEEEGKTPLSLVPGDKLSYKSNGVACKITVLVNSTTEFKWYGWVYGHKGEHAWRFEDSKDPGNEGGTHFVHEEEFSGVLAWLIRPGWSGGEFVRKKFEEFNTDLKKRVESIRASETVMRD